MEHMLLKVHGKINPNCMYMEDIDGDGINELVVCNSGEMLVAWEARMYTCETTVVTHYLHLFNKTTAKNTNKLTVQQSFHKQ